MLGEPFCLVYAYQNGFCVPLSPCVIAAVGVYEDLLR
jgi:hypothetical protein